MPDALIPISGRSVTLKYRDMGDGSFARVVSLGDYSVTGNQAYRVSSRALPLRYTRSIADATHAETYHIGASAQGDDKLVEISGRSLTLRYRKLSDGTYAECVWVGKSSKATDKIYRISGRGISIRYRDMGDGTFAMVVWEGSSAQATDRLYSISARGVSIKYRDMGDGTFAEVVYDQFSPAALFADGVAGPWFDGSDFSTMFQDRNGTTPVTALEQTVGQWHDKSGNGIIAVAPNDGSRGVVTARVNLLERTEDLGNAAWSKNNVSISANTITVTSTGSFNSVAQFITTAIGVKYTFRASLNAGTSTQAQLYYGGGATNSTATRVISGPGSIGASGSNSVQVTNLSASIATVVEIDFLEAAGGSRAMAVYPGNWNAQTAGDSVKANYIDVRPSDQATGLIPAYQRVTTATDYDSAGFPVGVRFDGSDDSYSTAAIDYSGTDKVTVFAGTRKLVDAVANQVVLELSNSVSSNNGSFLVRFPTNNEYHFHSKGTAEAIAVSSTTYNAPITNVLTGIGDIGAPVATLRANGAQVGTTTASQGSGNFGNYPLFMGRRNNTNLPFNGLIYQLIAPGKLCSASEIAATEAWVNGKTKAY